MTQFQARGFNGSNQYTGLTSAVLTTTPISMACQFKSDDATKQQFMMSLVNYAGGGSGHFHVLAASGTVGGDPIRALTFGGSTVAAATTTGFTAGQWHHACGVWAASNDRRAYIDGGSKGTNSSSQTPSSLSRTSLGTMWRSDNPGVYFDGSMLWPAIWNCALSDIEVKQLALGKPPWEIRRDKLVACWPMSSQSDIGDRDIARQYHMTPYNTPLWVAGPSTLPEPEYDPSVGMYMPCKLGSLGGGAVSFSGAVTFYGTVLGNGVVSNSYSGITYDSSGNLRVSGQVYEGP